MIKGDYDELTAIAANNVCSEHNTPLSVAWHDKEAIHVIRCGHGEYPDDIVRIMSLTEDIRQGKDVPEPIKSNVEKASRRRSSIQPKNDLTPALSELPKTDLGTGEILAPHMVTALLTYAYRYGLDPFRGHVVIYYGKPYIGIDGYLYHANQVEVPYSLRSKPLNKEQRIEYLVPEGSHAWLATVEFLETGQEFNGIGIVTAEELTEKSKRDQNQLRYPVVAKHPWQLAQKRAEWQALRRAFPIGESEEKNDEG